MGLGEGRPGWGKASSPQAPVPAQGGSDSEEGDEGGRAPPLFLFLNTSVEFMGVTSASIVMQVSRVPLYDAPPVCGTACSPAQVKPPPITVYPPLQPPTRSHPPVPLVITTLCVSLRGFIGFCVLLNPLTFCTPPHSAPPLQQLSVCPECLGDRFYFVLSIFSRRL